MLILGALRRIVSRLVCSAPSVFAIALAVPFLLMAEPARAVDRPIVFIPGILGSVLSDAVGNILWGDNKSLFHLEKLTIPNGPRDPTDGLNAIGIIDQIVIFGPWKVKQYSTLRDKLLALGYEPGKTYFEFPYDWRQSNYTSAKKLLAFVNNTPQLKDKEFDIVAHSMGGLVAQIYVKEIDQGRKVRRVVNMAVPFLGSANTFATLTDGWGTGANLIAGGMAAIRSFALSLPSFYELLPQYRYCCILGRPDGPRRPYNPLLPADWDQIAWFDGPVEPGRPENVSRTLVGAQRLRDLASAPYPAQVNAFFIVGGSVDTRWQYYVDPAPRSIVKYNSGPGDGTVPEGSAANNDLTRAFVSLAQHQTIFEDVSAKTTLERIVRNAGLPELYNAATNAVKTKDGAIITISSVGLTIAPPVITPTGEAQIEIRVGGAAGAPLDSLDVTALAEGATITTGSVSLQATLETTSNASQGVYRGALQGAGQSGILTLHVFVPGLPGLEDYVMVLQSERQ
jgi:pimeloyl-ACP methyl ester carboxylesterase